MTLCFFFFFFCFNDTATTEIYTLSLHDALPISPGGEVRFENPDHLALLDSSELLTIRLYQNSDAEKVLWLFSLGSGLDVISSLDPDREERGQDACIM